MNAIEVRNLGVRFKIFHQKNITLRETFINLVQQKVKRNNIPIYPAWENFWALRNVSFDVKKGESVGIIGRNGSGKSTLLTVLSRIYSPDEGEVRINGRILGLLQLGAGFHYDFSGRENIYLNGSILGFKKSEIDRMYDAIVEFSELERFIDTPIRNYSSGMKARLGFSIAINVNPDILLLDEILATGDQAFKEKSKLKMYEFREQRKTIVFVSHSLDEVKKICDRVIIIDQGKLVFDGDTTTGTEMYLKMTRGIQKVNVSGAKV